MRSVWLYFALALGGTWLLQLPALLGACGVLPGGVAPYMLPAALGGFCPLIAALVAARSEGAGRVRELFASLRPRTGLAGWYLLALLLFPLLHVLGEAAYRVAASAPAGDWLYPPRLPQQWVVLVLIPLVEETGWRGFALPRLAERFGWLRASWLVGVGWAAWHTLMFVLQGFDSAAFALGMLMIVAGQRGIWLALRSHPRQPAGRGARPRRRTPRQPDARPTGPAQRLRRVYRRRLHSGSGDRFG